MSSIVITIIFDQLVDRHADGEKNTSWNKTLEKRINSRFLSARHSVSRKGTADLYC